MVDFVETMLPSALCRSGLSRPALNPADELDDRVDAVGVALEDGGDDVAAARQDLADAEPAAACRATGWSRSSQR